jgi:uncharacterized membrane-anchored protein YhcB (DUF1043 family)
MPVDRIKEVFDSFYQKHHDKLAWAFVIAIGTGFSAGIEFGYWRWTVLNPAVEQVAQHTKELKQREKEFECFNQDISARIARLEGKLGSTNTPAYRNCYQYD